MASKKPLPDAAASHGEQSAQQQQAATSGGCSWGDGRHDAADIFEEGFLPCPELRCRFDFNSLDDWQRQECTPLCESDVLGQRKKESGAGEPCSGPDNQAKAVSERKEVSRSGSQADDCLIGQGSSKGAEKETPR
ncbi:uncharacterized protein LOC144123496 [Amblyomma americanum]